MTTKKKDITTYPYKWVGLPPKDFRKYRSWINREKPGICGTYVSAVLIHYLFEQEYGKDLDQDLLIDGLRKPVDHYLPYKGTFPWDLKRGLSFALEDIDGWTAKMAMIPDFKVVEELSKENPLPIAVGTTTAFGSSYKNHWLLVYAYGWNKNGKLFLKGYDNHGRYTAIVPASQTFGCVWLEKIEIK